MHQALEYGARRHHIAGTTYQEYLGNMITCISEQQVASLRHGLLTCFRNTSANCFHLLFTYTEQVQAR